MILFMLYTLNNACQSSLNSSVSNDASKEYAVDGIIKTIEESIGHIDSTTKWSNVIEKDIQESTEGGISTYYFKDDNLAKIVLNHYGEMFQSTQTYYVNSGELICFAEEKLLYNRPIYYDQEAMEENGDTTFFDVEKSTKTKYVYYFRGEKMVSDKVVGSEKNNLSIEHLQDSILREFDVIRMKL